MTTLTVTDDKDLLLRLRDGDEHAFETLYRKYSLLIYANILRMVHDEHVADDLLQEVFLKIWEKRTEEISLLPMGSSGGQIILFIPKEVRAPNYSKIQACRSE